MGSWKHRSGDCDGFTDQDLTPPESVLIVAKLKTCSTLISPDNSSSVILMADKEESRRKGLILQAVNPVDGKVCEVQISFERMQTVARRSLGHAKECGYIVPMILQKPTAVFEGLRWDEDEDPRGVGWRCYCGIPERSYSSDGTPGRPYPNQVYLVFVNEEGVAYNWRWEKADADDLGLPQNHGTRFTQRLL
jgi:hypothetical protein